MFKKLFNTMIVDWQSGSSFVLGIFFRILPNLDLSLVYNLSFEAYGVCLCTQNYFVYSFQVDDDDLSMNHMLCDYHEKGLGSSVWAWKSNQDLKSWYCKLDWLEIQSVQEKFSNFRNFSRQNIVKPKLFSNLISRKKLRKSITLKNSWNHNIFVVFV